MKISLIIAFYKNIQVLDLIFKSLDNQSYKNFEVIIAEDDNNVKTQDFILKVIHSYSFSIKHIHQDNDDGFRKNKIINKAILQAEGDIIVFLDGDCIPHKHYIKTYANNVFEKTALFGRRVMVSQKLTDIILKTKKINNLNFWKLLFSDSKRVKYSIYLPMQKKYRKKGIWGCNWGIYKKHLYEINGFDEDYIRAGFGEDADIEWRLIKTNIQLLSVRFEAIVYHMYHESNYSQDDIQFNKEMLIKKKENNDVYCRNGLIKK